MSTLPKLPAIVSPAIRNLPKHHDVPCILALFGCRADPQYTVLAHLRGKWALGMAQKPHDFFGLYLCDRCHDILDERSHHTEQPSDWEILNALYRSQQFMVLHGVLKLGV
jgi:hypothetical protein